MHGILKRAIVGVVALGVVGGAAHAQRTVCDSPCVIMRLPQTIPNDTPVPNSNPLAELQGKVTGANIIRQGGERDYSEFEVSKTATEIRNGVAPQFPDAMLDRKISGLVATIYVVGTDGRVDTSTFRVLDTSGGLFSEAVREAIPRMRYLPAQLNGRAVRQIVKRTFDFDAHRAVPCEAPCPFMYLPLESHPVPVVQQSPPYIVGHVLVQDFGVGPPIFFSYEVDRPATQAAASFTPQYPDSLMRAKVEGQVMASFVVDTTGHIDAGSIMIVSATHPLFATAVLDALPKMMYVPAQLHGQKVRQRVRAPFTFTVKK